MGRMRLLNPLQLPVAARQCIFTAMKRSISWCSPVLIGVSVILATFLVKDVLRDEAKDRVAALETAQRAYDTMSD